VPKVSRPFALLWIGQSTSAVGSAITSVALPLVAISTLHADAAQVTLLTAATWMPWLLIGLPAGVWVDRWPRRRTLLLADLGSAAVLVVIPVAAWSHRLTLPLLLGAALLAGVGGVFTSVAFNAFLPHLVGPDALMASNAKLQTSAAIALVVGPGLGGLVAQAAGAVSGILLDAVTFVVSAACLLALRPAPEVPLGVGEPAGLVRQIAEGIGFILRGRLLQAMLVVAAVTNFAMLGLTALRVVFLVRTEGVAPGPAGLAIGAGSVGAIAGAALAARLARRFGSARTYLVANLGAAPFALVLPLGGPGWRLALFAAGSCVALGGAAVANVMTLTFRGTFVPAHLLGRVTAASRIFVFGAIPFGAATAGLLASTLGVRGALWGLAGLYAAAPLPLLATEARTLRDFPRGATPDAPLRALDAPARGAGP
jgi:MFS family permease